MSRTLGAALSGVEGQVVEVEVRISSQLPRVDVVGLPEAAVRESAARVRAAIAACGLRFPDRRVTVNLAPAGLRKSGAGLDLPIALAILAAQGEFEMAALAGRGFFGELALDGRLRTVRGALSMALALRDAGCEEVIAPTACATQAALAPRLALRAAANLREVLAHLSGAERLPRALPPPFEPSSAAEPCLSEVRGQEVAKRAVLVAAAGGHGLLFVGPPGSGKTMLARRLAGLLPPLSFDEAVDATRIHSAAGRLGDEERVVSQRPFRAPHHTASAAGLLGGGTPPRPGEVSLAHRGVLFLDELPEFDRRSLEALRQVLEERSVTLARASGSVRFPASFQLVAACNPCPCGWYGSAARDCRCDDAAVARYRRRVSGPLLDRIDLHVELQPVPWRALAVGEPGPSSARIRPSVERVRKLAGGRGVASNAEIPDRDLDATVRANAAAASLLGRAVDQLGLSARGARRVLRVARTIADLAGEAPTGVDATAEAISYRDGSPAGRV